MKERISLSFLFCLSLVLPWGPFRLQAEQGAPLTREIPAITPSQAGEPSISPPRVPNLGEALKENPEHNIRLKEDDYLFVRQIPEWYMDKIATIHGEMKFPGVYSLGSSRRPGLPGEW